jgi:hypothetical protein
MIYVFVGMLARVQENGSAKSMQFVSETQLPNFLMEVLSEEIIYYFKHPC